MIYGEFFFWQEFKAVLALKMVSNKDVLTSQAHTMMAAGIDVFFEFKYTGKLKGLSCRMSIKTMKI